MCKATQNTDTVTQSRRHFGWTHYSLGRTVLKNKQTNVGLNGVGKHNRHHRDTTEISGMTSDHSDVSLSLSQ